jgi:hypothetical protein
LFRNDSLCILGGLPNKALVLTMPAHRSFYIIARYKGLGGWVGFVLPVTALAWPYNAGVMCR